RAGEAMDARGNSTRAVATRAFLTTIVALATIVAVLALWELRVLVALLFLALIVAAAMRPGVDALAEHRIPRAAGVLIHYGCLVIIVGVVLWFVVPTSLHQVQSAIGEVPTTRGELN